MKYLLAIFITSLALMGTQPVTPDGDRDMINPQDLKDMIVDPILVAMDQPNLWPGANHPAASNLMTGTFYVESTIGINTHLKQFRGGPGLGPYQIERNTLIDGFVSKFVFRPDRMEFAADQLARTELPSAAYEYLVDREDANHQYVEDEAAWIRNVGIIVGSDDVLNALYTNLDFATVMARNKYYMRTFRWPDDPNDLHALGVIWNEAYNTNPNHGEPEDFVRLFPRNIL